MKSANETKKRKGLSSEEVAAMKEYMKELNDEKTEGEGAVLDKISKMPEPDRTMAKQFHAMVKASAPALTARTWYGMPAYEKDGKVICFFQNASKFKTRYSTVGFSDKANLDEGQMWPVTFAVTKIGAAEEARIRALLKKAIG